MAKSARRTLAALFWILLCAGHAAQAGKKERVREEVAVIRTTLGEIVFRLFPDRSPKAVEAFKLLALSGFYDGTQFDEVLPGLLVSAGNPQNRDDSVPVAAFRAESVEVELNDLKHHAATVSLAMSPVDHKSRSIFLICLQPVSYFDGKHTVIGEVISGMKVVEAISQVPRNLKHAPLKPIRIRRLSLEIQEYLRETKQE